MTDYNVQSSDGTFTVNVQTGTINNTFDIPFMGQDSINYGDDLVAAQLRQLENFSNTTEPAFGTTRVKGQLWYDSTPTTGRLNIFDGSSFVKLPLDIDVVHLSGAETILGVKTFSSAPIFSASGAPMTVNSGTVVTNLNADKLDGEHLAFFATAIQGTKADNAQIALPANSISDGHILSSTIAGVFTWISPSVSSGLITPVDASTAANPTLTSLILSDTATGNQDPLTDSNLTYNSQTNALSCPTFVGALTGNATTASTASTATTATNAENILVADTASASTFVVVVDTATGNQAPLTDGALTYNASTGALSATAFVGDGSSLTDLAATNIAGTLQVNQGGTGVTTSTGTGATVRGTTPTFTTNLTVPLILSATGVAIQWNSVTEVVTQSNTATGQTTGAQVRHHDTNLYDIGMNVLPQFGWDTSDTLEARHCGMLTGHSNGSAHTLTIPASSNVDFPIGGVATIINGGAIDYTIVDDATATLFYIEPGLGGTDIAGTMIIGPGGVATLYRFSATIYYIWGNEITP